MICMNLKLLHTPNIKYTMLASLVFWAPYYPVDGPIEYVFNTIQHDIALSMYEINTICDLINKIRASVRSLNNFVNYFISCGFTR